MNRSSSPGNLMRTVGAAILGLFLGLLAGILLTEVGGRILVAAGSMSSAGTAIDLVLGLVLPVCGIVGAVLGAVIGHSVRAGDRRQ